MPTITANTERGRRVLRYIRTALNRQNLDRVVRKEADILWRRLRDRTPVGLTRHTHKQWKVEKLAGGGYSVVNDTDAMQYLEHGTRAHGPVNATRLFIPLTRRAAVGGWNRGLKYGRDYVLAKRVRGIRAHNIVARERPAAQLRLVVAMQRYVRQVVRNASRI